MDNSTEHNVGYLKDLLDSQHKALETFLSQEPMSTSSANLVKPFVPGRRNAIVYRQMTGDKKYFERNSEFIRLGFERMADELQLGENKRTTFTTLMDDIKHTFYELIEAKQNKPKTSEATLKGQISSTFNELRTFCDTQLGEAKFKDIYELGSNKSSARLRLLNVVHKDIFPEAINDIEKGFKELHSTVNFDPHTVKRFNEYISSIREMRNMYMDARAADGHAGPAVG